MQKIAIIGSGYAGMLMANALLKDGHEVCVYSDRSAEDWLYRSKPTGIAARFGLALDYERELGLNHWEQVAPSCGGAHLTFSPKDKNTLVTLAGKLNNSYAQAIDLRLQCYRWMNDFEKQGGRIVIEKVTVDRLDNISLENDLTFVAIGRGPLANLFELDEEKSVYKSAQRKLAMVLATDDKPMNFKGIPFLPIKINFLAKYGEAFWMPYYHKTHGQSWSLLFEAKNGGKMDQFDDCPSGETILERAKKVIKELMPHDYEWCKNLKLADELGWVKGEVKPTVRNPKCRLPSGRFVMALGDTLISMDPIGGQGANLANKYVKHLVHSIRTADKYDEKWMQTSFDDFWYEHGKSTVQFNNTLLEPLTKAGMLMMISQYGSTGNSKRVNQQIANLIIENFRDPRTISDAFLDFETAKSLISFIAKRSWIKILVPSLLRAIKSQLRQAVGLTANHPLSSQLYSKNIHKFNCHHKKVI